MGLFSSKKEAPVQQDGMQPTLLEAEERVQKRYDREVWWLDNRHKLRALGVIVLIVIEAALALTGIWAFVDYFLIDYVPEQRLVEGFFTGAGTIALGVDSQQPDGLNIERVRAVSSGSTFDLVGFIENPNADWVAEVTYRLSYRGEQTDQATVLVIQNTTMPVTVFGLENPRPSSAEMLVDDVKWYRIDAHGIPDPVTWKNQRLNFDTSDVQHTNDIEIGDKVFGRTTFTLHNKTGFGYFEVPLTIVLRRGGTIVGVNRVVATNLEPREQRQMQIDWFDRSPQASSIEIYPGVNIFDETVYLPTDGQAELDPRDTLLRRR